MEIGTKQISGSNPFRTRRVNELIPEELREAVRLGNGDGSWSGQQKEDEGLNIPEMPYKHGNSDRCVNDDNPDDEIPADLFKFELILSGRKFKVVLDALLRIKTTEDLAYFTEVDLKRSLELCASYRATCFVAHIAAHREFRRWRMYNSLWMAEKREEARVQMRADRIADKVANLRKELGQITNQELDDWIMNKYTVEYKQNVERMEEWEDNAKVYLELRDILKDRGTHLQTLIKRANDQTDPAAVSSGEQGLCQLLLQAQQGPC